MHELSGSVLGVSGRQTRNGKTVYEVAFSDGQKYTTFNNALAQQAQGIINQPAVAQVEVTQNGQYTNYNLVAIRSANGVQAPTSTLTIPLAPATSPSSRGGRDPEVEARIVRQSSMSTAFNFVGHVLSGSGDLETAKEKALELAKEIFSHAFGNKQVVAEAAAQPQTAPEVVAQVNQVLGTEAVTQGVQAQTPAQTPDW